VAENHLSEVLINPIIELYITGNGDSWDWLDEQGSFLIGKACAEIGRPAIKAFLDTIETFVKKNTELPVLYLHECIHFVDKEEDLPQILSILQHVDYKWMDSFATHLAQAQIKGALPKLQEILKYYKNKSTEFLDTFTIAELEEAIQELETGISPVANSIFPFYQNRSNWKEAYKYFYREKDDDFMPPPAPAKKKKIGRNDPCPCGSGKKFKKCCIKLYS
jgi:uncharacterized protein YecA (UPF0149 family)